jgi:hypothetical protein
MAPDTRERRPRPEGGAQDAANVTARVASGEAGGRELAALRCWTWRAWHLCGCPTADDCLLHKTLLIHPEQPCRGMFGDGGKWQPCCRGAA